jgi:hypothetical protein
MKGVGRNSPGLRDLLRFCFMQVTLAAKRVSRDAASHRRHDAVPDLLTPLYTFAGIKATAEKVKRRAC